MVSPRPIPTRAPVPQRRLGPLRSAVGAVATVAATVPHDTDAHPKVEIREKSLRFLAADVAVEDGTVAVTPPGATRPHSGWFTALWTRVGGEWKLAGLRESRIESPADAPRLADLEWMVGEWSAVEDRAADAAAVRAHRRPDPRVAPENRPEPIGRIGAGNMGRDGLPAEVQSRGAAARTRPIAH